MFAEASAFLLSMEIAIATIPPQNAPVSSWNRLFILRFEFAPKGDRLESTPKSRNIWGRSRMSRRRPDATMNFQNQGQRAWPIFLSLRDYHVTQLGRDIVAGITLAAIAIPEQMATARLGGFAPEMGFFAFVAGSLAFAVFGANRFLSAGADSTITPIFAGGLVLLAAAGTPEYAGMAAMLALIVGVILIGGGLFRLGWIADLLSVPVVTGFLAGISVHIIISQLPGFLGVPVAGDDLFQRASGISSGLDQTN
jgi:MFS superfamily sulfate permease-like transporter